MNMQATKTQKRCYEELVNSIKVLKKYKSFEEFFEKSIREQNYLTTAFDCNLFYNSVEKYKSRDLEGWQRMEKLFKKATEENIIKVFAKTETIEALERLGMIEIIERANIKGGRELVKVNMDV